MSPTFLEASWVSWKTEIFGVLTVNFLFSIAALKRIQGIEPATSSFPTSGTVYCSSGTASGSKPAMNAEVSRIMTLFVVFYLQKSCFRLQKRGSSVSVAFMYRLPCLTLTLKDPAPATLNSSSPPVREDSSFTWNKECETGYFTLLTVHTVWGDF